MKNIAYLIPEFPGQTHVWMWREIEVLREWGVPIRLFSTRRPPERDRARHAFADGAAKETYYLWPASAATMAGAVLRALAANPIGFVACLRLAFTLPVDRCPRFRELLPLLAPACILAAEARRRDIAHLHVHSCRSGAILAMMLRRLAGV